MEDQDRSRVTDMERKVQSLTATNEQLDEKLKSSNDERKEEKEALTNKLEERNNEYVTLQARCSSFMSEVDQEILERRKVADLIRSTEAKWEVYFKMILVTLVELVNLVVFLFRLYYDLYWINLGVYFLHFLHFLYSYQQF